MTSVCSLTGKAVCENTQKSWARGAELLFNTLDGETETPSSAYFDGAAAFEVY
jgi:hypothetical protein